MNRRAVKSFGASALVALLWATSAAAQQPQSESQSQTPATSATQGAQQQPGQSGIEIDVNSLLGSKVRSKDGRDIGSVDRLMVDPKEGRVTTMVISMGGTLGMGARTLAVPWQSVQVAREGENVIVSLDEQLLQEAPPRAGERQPERQPERQQPAASPGTGQPPPAQQPAQPQPRQQ